MRAFTVGPDQVLARVRTEQGGQMDPAVLTIFVIAILVVAAIAIGVVRNRR